MNMPSFGCKNSRDFWKSCEENERENANTFRTIDFSLPAELSDEENIELASNFVKELFKNNFVYSLAVHSKPSSIDTVSNIHCHIMFSERRLDGIERNSEQFFKRYNSKNPSLGGAKKDREWHKYSKLYEIRQTWEKMANEVLQEKGIELISSKSLKMQRVQALLEENYLKAELLDRPPINIDKTYMNFASESSEKQKAVEFFNYAKRIKEIKEKEFRLKSENFEEENLKAKERFLKEIYKTEGKEYNSSDFDVSEKIINDTFNFENIFIKSLENNILLEKKESRLKQINSITDEDIENRALNILTKGEYNKKENSLKEINEFYNKLANKDTFKHNSLKNELENYFDNLSKSEYFQNKLFNMKKNIKEKYLIEKEEIFRDLEFLRNNNFRDIYRENTPQNYQRSKQLYKETKNYIEQLKKQKEAIDFKVSEYKKNYLDKDIKKDIYLTIKPEIVAKYTELQTWKTNLYSIHDEKEWKELNEKILRREMGFKDFDIANNVKEKMVTENTISLNLVNKNLTIFENSYKISSEQFQLEKQLLAEKNIGLMINIREQKQKLNIYFSMLKALKMNKPKIKRVKPNYLPQVPKHLKVVQSGRIEINDEENRREIEWENSL